MPLLAVVVMLVLASISFSQADRVKIPPAPDALFVERVQIDDIRHSLEPAGPAGPAQSIPVAVRLGSSADWPGLTFRFAGPASEVSVVPPVTFDLYLASSLQEQAERHRQWPNVFPVLEVHGVAEGGELLVDPQARHTANVDRKRRGELLGYGLLALALLPGIILFREGRRLSHQ
jgi:hypothetical protein